MSSEKSSGRVQIWVAVISVVGVLGAAVVANFDKIAASISGAASTSTPRTETTPAPTRPQTTDPLVGNYQFATDPNRLIKITALSGDRYIVEEPVLTAWPWKGTVTREGNRLTGLAEFPKSKATMRIVGEIRTDGSIVVEYKFITKGDGSIGEGVVHPHVWVKRPG